MAFRTLMEGWDPVRRGAIYCSPRCGCRCTHKAFVAATEKAKETAKRLGDAWQPVVWENCGWHWKAELRTSGSSATIEVRAYSGRDFRAEIHAGYLDGPHEGASRFAAQFWGSGTTPLKALAQAIASASKAKKMIGTAAGLAYRESGLNR